MIARYMLLWLSLFSLLALMWPEWIGTGFDPFLWGDDDTRSQVLQCLFAGAMFSLGWLMPRAEVLEVAKRWPVVLGGTTLQYVTMPALAFAVGKLFGFEGNTLIGVVMVGCVPGAMASNVLTLMAKGNVSYSLSLTMSATLLSPLVVPFALLVTLRQTVPIKPGPVAWNLLWMTVIPVILGHLAGHRVPGLLQKWAGSWAAAFANLVILLIIINVVAESRETLRQASFWLPLALLSINLLGYASGWAGGWAMKLDVSMRRALVLEIGMQNAGMGALLAGKFFGSEAAMPAALYTFGCMLTGTILARIWHSMPASGNGLFAKFFG